MFNKVFLVNHWHDILNYSCHDFYFPLKQNSNLGIDYIENMELEKKKASQTDSVESYEAAFERIREITGENDLDLLVNKFIESEDINFALFNYVNEQNNEKETIEDSIQKVVVISSYHLCWFAVAFLLLLHFHNYTPVYFDNPTVGWKRSTMQLVVTEKYSQIKLSTHFVNIVQQCFRVDLCAAKIWVFLHHLSKENLYFKT